MKPREANFYDRFKAFYNDVFLEEHKNKYTVGFHILGTILGLLLLFVSFVSISVFWIVTFPIVHGLPGILAHRFFERNQNVGDLRITRKDYPMYWFIIANHILTYQVFIHRKTRSLI